LIGCIREQKGKSIVNRTDEAVEALLNEISLDPRDLRLKKRKRAPPAPKKVREIKDFAFPLAWPLLHIRCLRSSSCPPGPAGSVVRQRTNLNT
jgi:hypothetical protein